MNKNITTNKENTTGSFYHSYRQNSYDEPLFGSSFRVFDGNSFEIDNLSIEADSLIQKFTDKLRVDEVRIERNDQEITEINKEIEQYNIKASNDKEIDQILKSQKEVFKDLYSEEHNDLSSINRKCKQ